MKQLEGEKENLASKMKALQEEMAMLASKQEEMDEIEAKLKHEENAFNEFKEKLATCYLEAIAKQARISRRELLDGLKLIVKHDFLLDVDKRTENFINTNFSTPNSSLLDFNLPAATEFVKQVNERSSEFRNVKHALNNEFMVGYIQHLFDLIDAEALGKQISIKCGDEKFTQHALDKFKQENPSFGLEYVPKDVNLNISEPQRVAPDVDSLEKSKVKEIKRILYIIKNKLKMDDEQVFEKIVEECSKIAKHPDFPITGEGIQGFFVAMTRVLNYPLFAYETKLLDVDAIQDETRERVKEYFKSNGFTTNKDAYISSLFDRVARVFSCANLANEAKETFNFARPAALNSFNNELIAAAIFFLLSAKSDRPISEKAILEELRVKKSDFKEVVARLVPFVNPVLAISPQSNKNDVNMVQCQKCKLKTKANSVFKNKKGEKICFLCYNELEQELKDTFSFVDEEGVQQ